MEQRRFLLFLVLSVAVLFAWQMFVVAPHNAAVKRKQEQQKALAKSDSAKTASVKTDEAKSVAKTAEKTGDEKTAKTEIAKVEKPKPKVELAPTETVTLGSLDPASGYFIQAKVVTTGAAVNEIALNDKRYRQIANLNEQFRVVGTNRFTPLRTFATAIDVLDEQYAALSKDELAKLELESKPTSTTINWKVVKDKTEFDANDKKIVTAVVFSLQSPDANFEVLKRYSLVKPEGSPDNDHTGYQLLLDLSIHSKTNKTVKYVLQGPVGVPLENIDNTSKFRDVFAGLLDPEGRVSTDSISAANLVEAVEDDEVESWKVKPLRFIGIDVLYFASLVVPQEDQNKTRYIATATPMQVTRAGTDSHSDISVQLHSVPLEIPAGGTVTHKYALYAGPKQAELLESIDAADILDYGRILGFIAKGMLGLLAFFHSIGLPYWLCIICLTVVVRGCLFPLSKKQAISARKMKELQPKIAELKKKYANDKQKLAQAQMELFAKGGANPLAGCLPLLLQLPIFIGLYTALGRAIELRLADFLWIENLAAPDALFPFGFRIPLVGWETFNLLPIITIVLFIVQQKMFMPPPTDEQQAMQYKIMNYMMIFMGFIFYKMPAGLCVYFIASSSWGMGERKLLDRLKPPEEPPPEDGTSTNAKGPPAPKKSGPTFFERLLVMADKPGVSTSAEREQKSNDKNLPQKPKRKNKGKKSR
ncbi:MAG: YidC/Oxa1 family insertase periplasmic-domain containing protein [Planctomycetota bacterium]|nr:YidC/Oxa1 family insertase periplasmic-domain containing protein [Planctomycetota bacterium]